MCHLSIISMDVAHSQVIWLAMWQVLLALPHAQMLQNTTLFFVIFVIAE